MTQLESIYATVVSAAAGGDDEQAWHLAQPLLRALPDDREAAKCLVRLVSDRNFAIEQALDALSRVEAVYRDDEDMLALIGGALEGARDIDQLNSAPPDHALFATVVDRLTLIADRARGSKREEAILDGLATGARMMARQRDSNAERSYRRLVALDPGYAAYHYNLGLFYKTRGRFREGLLANQAAAELVDEPEESYQWNLGICATGAGEGRLALEVWQRMQQKIELGRFDLPEGGYPHCKVRLAERPLAERGADEDDPGLEETIWIDRLSPCHGIVRSVLYRDLGVDYGDLVLFDGAPITYHRYGDREVPVFPHLATLARNRYRFFDFAATQDESGRIADLSRGLAEDAIVYPHSENYRTLCASCWRDPDLDHAHHQAVEKHVVSGRIAAPPGIDPGDLLAQIDSAIADLEPCRIFSPGLSSAAGQDERALFEQRRFDMLTGS